MQLLNAGGGSGKNRVIFLLLALKCIILCQHCRNNKNQRDGAAVPVLLYVSHFSFKKTFSFHQVKQLYQLRHYVFSFSLTTLIRFSSLLLVFQLILGKQPKSEKWESEGASVWSLIRHLHRGNI